MRGPPPNPKEKFQSHLTPLIDWNKVGPQKGLLQAGQAFHLSEAHHLVTQNVPYGVAHQGRVILQKNSHATRS